MKTWNNVFYWRTIDTTHEEILSVRSPSGSDTSTPLGADPMLRSVSRSAGSSLCEQHKDYRYRTGKSPAEKKTGIAYSVQYYPWYRPRLPAVNDSSNFRLEWISIRIYVVSLTDL